MNVREAAWAAILVAATLATLVAATLATSRQALAEETAAEGDAPRSAADADVPPESSVGIPARIEQVVLPGTELQAAPWDDRRAPVVAQVLAVFPHGDAFRYDLEFIGLEPGEHNLCDYLRRKDGGSTADLPPLLIRVSSALPAGQVLPNALDAAGTDRLGGYRALFIVGGVVWFAGLAAILFYKSKPAAAHSQLSAAPATLADRLRPLVEAASRGELQPGQHALLEGMLLAYWRRRLGLERMKSSEAISELRRHPDAGELLRQLDAWLHAPTPPVDVDVARMLVPYRQVSLAEFESQAVAAAHERNTVVISSRGA